MRLPSAKSTTASNQKFWLAAGVLILGVFLIWKRNAVPDIPIPSDLGRLEPQLQNYLAFQIGQTTASPSEPGNHSTLGMVYAVNGLWREALGCFSNYHRLKPSEPLGMLYLGVAKEELGDLPGASECFSKLVLEHPDFPQGYYRQGEIGLKMGQLAIAEKAFERLLQLSPDEWRGHAGLGECLLRLNKPAESVLRLQKALQLDPTAKPIHNLLGLAFRALGRDEEAKRELQLGLNSTSTPMADPWLSGARQHLRLLQDLFALADDFADSGKPDQAVKVLEEVLPFHPTNEMVINKLSIAYNRAQTPEKSIPLLTNLLLKLPNHLPSIITLSHSFQGVGKSREALEYADRAIQLSPKTIQGYLAQANAFLGLRNDKEAAESLGRALQLDPGNAAIYLELGDVQWRFLSQPDEAARNYRKALEIDPLIHDARARLAEFELSRKSLENAELEINRLRQGDPNHPALPGLTQRLDRFKKSPSGRQVP